MILLISSASAHIPLDVGDWTITEIDARPAAEGGQWFELRNNDESDGNNLVENGFRDADGDTISLLTPLIAHEGDYVVLASEESTMTTADFWFDASFSLDAARGSITLVDHTRGDIDTVAWDESWGASGGALAVDIRFETDAAANDLLSSWCIGEGTPGVQNTCDRSTTDDDGDGISEQAGDCDDADGARYPGAAEVACDGIDQDCDGADACAVDTGDDTGVDTAGDTARDTAPLEDSGDSGGADDTGEASVAPPDCGCGGRASPAVLLVLALAAKRRK